MRDFLNAILTFLSLSSLTDDEFDSLEIESAGLDVETYEALDAIVAARDSVSDARDRLRYYFLAKGVSITEVEGSSNILVGGSVCS